MRKKNYKWLRYAVAGIMMGLVPGTFAQKKKPADAPVVKAVPVPGGKAAAQTGDAPKPSAMQRRDSFDLTVEQEEHFRKLLPKTLAKLTNREPVHMVALGDSIVDMYLYDEANNDWLKSYPAMFGRELATQFYYTAGVRVIQPGSAKAAKTAAKGVAPKLGPEITFRSLGRGGKLMLHAMQTLTTYGFEHQPDLVMVSFGINDSSFGMSLATYARALQEVIETVRSKGAELILLGPTLTVEDPPEASMGMTRPYVDTMREIAADSGVLFIDLGDLSSLVAVADTVTEPAGVFEQVVKQYRRFFNHGGTVDFTHPRPELHSLLGKRIFAEVTKGPVPSAWMVGGGTATLEATDKLTLRYDLKNRSDKETVFSVLPLVVREWKPMDAAPQITLKAGESMTMQVSYARQASITGGIPSHEPTLRLPVLISGAGMTRIEDVRAEIRPFTLLWKLDALFNQEKSFALESLLCNTTTSALKGTWSAEWLGQKRSGEFDIPVGEKKPLSLTFDLPSPTDPWRQTGPVTMEIAAAGLKLRFERKIEVSRNIGLKQYVNLTPAAAPEKMPTSGTTSPGVRLKADADANALYLTYEISGVNMEDDTSATSKGAFGFDVSLDARSYGKRLGFGTIDTLRLNGNSADGVYPFVNPQPWVFGNGYAASYDAKFIRGQLGSTLGGMRRFTVTLPRTYLYLHEWAIGNGNSQLGIRTNIAFWKGPRESAPNGDFPPDQTFSLVASGRHPDDAEGLAVLELTDKPTARWTVNPY